MGKNEDNHISRDLSRVTEFCNVDKSTGMVSEDAQDSKNNKLCIIGDNMFTKTTNT